MSTLHAIDIEGASRLETMDVQFKRILVAIDFSKQTPQILSAATQVAKLFGAEVFLVNAATPAVYGTGAEPLPVETFDVNLQIAQARMAELVSSEPSLENLAHQEIVAYAMPLDLVQQVIENKNVDLVITGSHGRGGIGHVALGSVAECILRTVRCPVMVIGPKITSENIRFDSILLAACLTTAGLRSAQYAAALAKHFHSKLTLLHVVEHKEPQVVPPILLEDEALRKLKELIPLAFGVQATAIPQIEYGNAGDVIASVALYQRSGLVVTGAAAEQPLSDRAPWSTLAEVIPRVPCPVLCVRGDFR